MEVINGYHGGFQNGVNNVQLQKCSDNSISKDDFNLNMRASLNSDQATINHEVNQSQGPGNYLVDNTFACDCGLEKARDLQLKQPNVNLTGGFGWMGENGCLIDNDSDLRSNNLTNMKYINQLDSKQNSGFFGRGPHKVDVESEIRDSLIIKDKRTCGPLSGVSTLDYTITPMIDRLKGEVQNSKHIIPEDSMNAWVRGGLPSRQIVRNKEYMKRLSEM
tara:strand:- start:6467 stop:7123 length:657 start_codon:yes stop_codon:yes gene_type:complete